MGGYESKTIFFFLNDYSFLVNILIFSKPIVDFFNVKLTHIPEEHS